MPSLSLPAIYEFYRSAEEMPEELRARAEDFSFKYGRYYDSYLINDPGKHYFWCRDRRGVVGMVRDGNKLHVVGGLLAADKDKETLLGDLVEFAHNFKFHISFWNIAEDEIALYRQYGFKNYKVGEDPVVNLETATWRGKDYEWVRRQENYCVRHGLQLREFLSGELSAVARDEIIAQLREVSQLHLADTNHGKEMGAFVGRFDPDHLRRGRLFYAQGKEHIEGFVVCAPGLGGEFWSIETYRRRPDAVRGTVPFLMLQVMKKFQQEGVKQVSLCLVPAVRCEVPVPNEPPRHNIPMFKIGLVFWWNHLNFLFDFRGIYHYKSRFRPDFRQLYVAAYPRMTYTTAASFFRQWGMFNVRPMKVLRSLVGDWRRRVQRSKLAQPDA